MRWTTATAVSAALTLSFANLAHADEKPLPRLRFGLGGGLGLMLVNTYVTHGDTAVSSGGSQSTRMYSAGFGLELRAGVAFTKWLAVEAQLFAESLIVVGDARAGALVELSPVRWLALSGGAGIGSLYMMNFLYPHPRADFAVGLVRAEVRIPTRSGSGGADVMTFGLEGNAGQVLGGTPVPGTGIFGARFVAGVMWN